MSTTTISIPLNRLESGNQATGGSINSRKTDAPVEGLIRSISQHGLLIPLLVRPGQDGKFFVIDGNRRLMALKAIHKNGGDTETPIPCIQYEDGDALEISMVTNIEREDLHPVDQFEVFAHLVQAGTTVDAIAKRYGMKLTQVRQSLALGKLAPEIRDAWRAGKISDDAAEAFALTSDHKTQLAAYKKAGKQPYAHTIKTILVGSNLNVDLLLKFVGKAVYEAEGHHVNSSLFAENQRDLITVSDLPALKRMAEEKLQSRCKALVEAGWKWAIPKTEAPDDLYSWRRVNESTYTKEQMTQLGVMVSISYEGTLTEDRGFVKPGDKVQTPKSKKQRKTESEAREKKKTETGGGMSNSLAIRLSNQLTSAMRESFAKAVNSNDIISMAIAALASANSPMKIKIAGESGQDADFVKYFELARSKTPAERAELLALWIAKSINLDCYTAEEFTRILSPKRGDNFGPSLIASVINPKEFKNAVSKHFDPIDYFSVVSKAMIEDAVQEALGDNHLERVLKMKAPEAREYATKHIPKTGWVPKSMRLARAD